jgi:N-acetylneuraminate synthase
MVKPRRFKKNDSTIDNMISINRKIIGVGHPAYIIAEIGSNFDGSLERAKMLVKLAKDSGADAFKIQNFLASKLVSEKGFSGFKVDYQSKWEKSVVEVYKGAEFPREWLKEISDYCKEIGIDFLSAPYDNEAVDELEKIGVAIYKIGSGEIDNLEFVQYVAKTKKPIILATGASSIEDIRNAVATIRETGNQQIILLQCVTNYPAMLKDANLNAMVALKNEFKTEVGVSDHTIGREGGGDDPLNGITVPLVSVALGGIMIEKHFTDDTKRKGQDHPFAMDASAFKKMVESVRALEKTLGGDQKKVLDSEKETVIIQRRGIYAKADIEKGETISREKIEFLRPALFLRPPQVKDILGKKTKYKISAGDPIKPDVI